MTLIDITPSVSPRLAVFPGDTQPSRELLCDLRRGDVVTLSTLRTTVHLGAHVDAPSHYGLDARTMEQQALDLYVGPCQVIRVPCAPRQRIAPRDLGVEIAAPRVLLATGTYPDPERWTPEFAALSVELVDFLADRGVRLIGIDTPSVDCSDSKDLPAHRRILARDLAILEGVVLDGVAPGAYELIALPLKLEGFDGSPVRAVLRRPDAGRDVR
jgi:arylformamidase